MDKWFGFDISTEESVALKQLKAKGLEQVVDGAELSEAMLSPFLYNSRERDG